MRFWLSANLASPGTETDNDGAACPGHRCPARAINLMTTSAVHSNQEELAARLSVFASAHYPMPVSVGDVRDFEGGHGGATFGFSVRDSAAGGIVDQLVIRLAPPGVRREGNADVVRLAPLLEAVAAGGVAVPKVRFVGEDTRWFGVSYLIVEFLPGRSFVVWEPDPAFDLRDAAVAPLWLAAARVQAAVHALDWREHLANWQAPFPVEQEIARFDGTLSKVTDADWSRQMHTVREHLLAAPPPPSPIGIAHGDCQPGNILYDDTGRVVAVLDWEASGIGAQNLDVGWLLMIGDREAWDAS